MRADDKNKEVMAAIADHLATVGGRDWDTVQKRFPHISNATFWRLIAKVRAAPPDERVLPKATKQAKRLSKKHIPAPVSPEYLAKGGARALHNVDFLTRFEGIWRDAEMLRAWAVKANADGTEAVRVPAVFSDSVKLRQSSLVALLQAMTDVYDLERQQAFYNAVVEEISKASPETAKAILARLEVLNRERGMTPAALG